MQTAWQLWFLFMPVVKWGNELINYTGSQQSSGADNAGLKSNARSGHSKNSKHLYAERAVVQTASYFFCLELVSSIYSY